MTYEQEILEAEARGRAEGKAEGKVEGKVEGKAEGKIEEKISIAENLIRSSIPIEVIAQSTELTLEQIKEIAVKIGVKLI